MMAPETTTRKDAKPPSTGRKRKMQVGFTRLDLLLLILVPAVLSSTTNMTWFERLVGFPERSPDQVRSNIHLEGSELVSKVNGERYVYGELEIPSLKELRDRVESECPERETTTSVTTVREEVANVQDLHMQESNAHALFQVASQFNLLEMASPSATPELGVSIFQNDPTQGPACAIAAGAGTIYRNYFVPLENGQVGQTKAHQVDCLADLGGEFGNTNNRLWKMKNGYCLAKTNGLEEITRRLQTASDEERYDLQGLLRVGIMWDTQVTLNKDAKHLVSQVYCSALPVAYSIHAPKSWQAFARLVLEAAYEATMCATILNFRRTGNNKVYLTMLGGGAFGNKREWIMSALTRAIEKYRNYALDIMIVSYGTSDQHVQQLISEMGP